MMATLVLRVHLGRVRQELDGSPPGASHIMAVGRRVAHGELSLLTLCIISVTACRLGFSMCHYLPLSPRRGVERLACVAKSSVAEVGGAFDSRQELCNAS